MIKQRKQKRHALMPEGKLQEAVVQLLRLHGRYDIVWWACPNGEWRSVVTGARLKRQGVRAGATDLMFVIGRMFHGLELKTEVGKQSDSQKQFELDLVRAGGVYHLAHGLREAIDVLNDLDVFRYPVHQRGRGAGIAG